MRYRRLLLAIAAALLVAWCAWASAFPAGTRDGQLVWLVSLAGVLAAAGIAQLRAKRYQRLPAYRTRPASREQVLRWLAPWLVLALIILAWEILGIDTGRHEPHLTISALTLAFRPLRALILAVWVCVGIYFAEVRSRRSEQRSKAATANPVTPPDTLAGVSLFTSAILLGHGHLLALLEGDSRAVGVAFWIGVGACGLVVESVARRSTGRVATFGELLAFVSRPPVARLLLAAAWVYAGWHLFAH